MADVLFHLLLAHNWNIRGESLGITVNVWDEHYGAFEPASPFEEDLDFEARRRIIDVNMYLDPTTTTGYGLGKQFDALMSFRRQRDRQEVLRHRLLALGLDPRKEQQPETRHLRAL